MDMPRFYSGNLLLAMPGIGDPNFEKSVIMLCSHDENGALGINLGQEITGLSLHGLLAQFELSGDQVVDCPLLYGGPVEPQRGFVLHSLDWGGQDMLQVGGHWGLSGSLDVLKAIAEGRGPTRYVVALGYAGWGEGQLEEEMTRHGWFIAPASDQLLFNTPASDRWTAAWSASGIDSSLLANQSGHA
ncbi:YqgE/AlgH family protein [Rhizorhapis sp. SPR117]|uniref:YqgE/AlgH family protein n=1 Tax=Rhizorhapis sp. SPR117 TaxID=2912611 RepID=UPI001F19F3B7|nr:YqgE/AlgH family protein [Rhizorhapis sp. SPR117]